MQKTDEFADSGGEGGFGGSAVWEGGAEAGVEFVGAGDADDFGEVGSVYAASGDDVHPVVGQANETRENGGPLGGGGFTAGGENAGGASLDDGFEGSVEVGRFVEGAMEGDGKRAGDFNEFARVLDVDRVVAVKNAEDDAVHFAEFGEVDVAAHLGEFGAGVDETAAARANHGEDGNFGGCAGFAHEFGAWRDAADGKVGAEFDSVCAAAFGGDGGGERFDGNFEKWGHGCEGAVRFGMWLALKRTVSEGALSDTRGTASGAWSSRS